VVGGLGVVVGVVTGLVVDGGLGVVVGVVTGLVVEVGEVFEEAPLIAEILQLAFIAELSDIVPTVT